MHREGCLTLTELFVQEGYTPLIAAAGAGQLACVALLLDHGADVNIADPVRLNTMVVE
jgi:ankyrin repeat protein